MFRASRVSLRALLVLAAAIMVTLCPLIATAHPHVFVYAGLQIVFDEKGLAGLRMLWIFDEMFSNMVISEFDQNGNGRFEPLEIEAVKNGAFSYLRNYQYFTHIKIDGHKFEVNYVMDFSARIKENQLVYEFLVPCHVNAAQAFKEVKLSVYDATYYCHVSLPQQAIAYEEQRLYDVEHRFDRNRDEAYYYGQIHPDEVTLRFRHKNG